MSASVERIRHNHQRMKILKALLQLVGVDRKAGFDELLEVCDSMGAPMVPRTLDFHLRYMRQEGWVKLRIERTSRKVDDIVGVTLTASGVDRIDIGRMPELEDTQKTGRGHE